MGGQVFGNHKAKYPNLQYHFGPTGFDYVGGKFKLSQAFTLQLDLLRPHSRGYLRLKSLNPNDAPKIVLNYLGADNFHTTPRFKGFPLPEP